MYQVKFLLACFLLTKLELIGGNQYKPAEYSSSSYDGPNQNYNPQTSSRYNDDTYDDTYKSFTYVVPVQYTISYRQPELYGYSSINQAPAPLRNIGSTKVNGLGQYAAKYGSPSITKAYDKPDASASYGTSGIYISPPQAIVSSPNSIYTPSAYRATLSLGNSGAGYGNNNNPGYGSNSGQEYGSSSGQGYDSSSGPGYGSTSGQGYGSSSGGQGYGSSSSQVHVSSSGKGYGSSSGQGYDSTSGQEYGSSSGGQRYGSSSSKKYGNSNTAGYGSNNGAGYGGNSAGHGSSNSPGSSGIKNAGYGSSSSAGYSGSNSAGYSGSNSPASAYNSDYYGTPVLYKTPYASSGSSIKSGYELPTHSTSSYQFYENVPSSAVSYNQVPLTSIQESYVTDTYSLPVPYVAESGYVPYIVSGAPTYETGRNYNVPSSYGNAQPAFYPGGSDSGSYGTSGSYDGSHTFPGPVSIAATYPVHAQYAPAPTTY